MHNVSEHDLQLVLDVNSWVKGYSHGILEPPQMSLIPQYLDINIKLFNVHLSKVYFNTKYNLSEDKKNMSLNFTLPYIKKKQTFHARPVNFN